MNIFEALANVGAFLAFVLYVVLGLAGATLAGFLVYMMVGGLLQIFGLDIFPADFFGN